MTTGTRRVTGAVVYLKSGSCPICVVKDEGATTDLCWMDNAGRICTITVPTACLSDERPAMDDPATLERG